MLDLKKYRKKDQVLIECEKRNSHWCLCSVTQVELCTIEKGFSVEISGLILQKHEIRLINK